MTRTFKTILVSAIGTAALIAGVPALSEPTPDVNVSIVQISDLDLATTSGQRRLDQRLSIAAHAVCDGTSRADLSAANSAGKCRRDVLSAGRAKANAMLAGIKAEPTIVVAASR